MKNYKFGNQEAMFNLLNKTVLAISFNFKYQREGKKWTFKYKWNILELLSYPLRQREEYKINTSKKENGLPSFFVKYQHPPLITEK